MPRLRITLLHNQRRQAFDLDAPVLTLGRNPDCSLVIPLPFIAPTHLVLEDLLGGYRLRPAASDALVLHHGKPLPPDGIELPHDQPISLTLPAPSGPPLELHAQPLPLTVSPTPLPVPAAPSRPETSASSSTQPVRPFPQPAASPTSRRPPAELLIAISLLLGSLAVVAAIFLSRPPPVVHADTPLAASAAETPAGEPPTRSLAADPDPLTEAARAYSLGDLAAARHALTQAALSAPDSPLVIALELALQRELQRQQSAPLEPVTPLRESPPASPPPVEPEPDSPARADSPTRPEQPPAPSVDPDLRRKLDELLARIEAAGADSAAVLKSTDLGQAALAEAQTHVRQRLAPSELTFPDPADSRILLVFESGVFLVRGFVDQWNQNNQPVRLFYLTRLRPTGLTTFEHLGTDILR